MDPVWQRYLDLAGGLTHATQRAAGATVKAFVKQGEAAADLAERALDDVLAGSEANRRAVTSLVRAETERLVEVLGLVRRSELEELRARLARLEARGDAPAGEAPATGEGESTGTTEPAAGKAAAREPAAGQTAAEKSTARRSPARKPAARKPAAKAPDPAPTGGAATGDTATGGG